MPKVCNHSDCPRAQFGGGYCKIHQYMRGAPPAVRQHKTARRKSGKQINAISPQLRKKAKEYSDLRVLYLYRHALCEAKLPNCRRIATDIHHKKGRGKYLNDITTWLPVCRNCHHRIETFPKEAKTLGLSQTRLV
jgi:hypothetical protein